MMFRRRLDPRTARRLAEIEVKRERQIERDAYRALGRMGRENVTREIPRVSMSALVGVR